MAGCVSYIIIKKSCVFKTSKALFSYFDHLNTNLLSLQRRGWLGTKDGILRRPLIRQWESCGNASYLKHHYPPPLPGAGDGLFSFWFVIQWSSHSFLNLEWCYLTHACDFNYTCVHCCRHLYYNSFRSFYFIFSSTLSPLLVHTIFFNRQRILTECPFQQYWFLYVHLNWYMGIVSTLAENLKLLTISI